MRRLALLLTGGAVWLFLAAIPVFADGGPHVASINNGTGGINADSCAGCHRAHQAQGEYLITEPTVDDLCLSCHGAAGTGATTNVEGGVQYAVSTGGTQVRGTAILGALRAGGFRQAAIGTAYAIRTAYLSGTDIRELPKVPARVANTDGTGALAPQNVTSAHINLDNPNTDAVAWGSGTSGVGGTGELECTSCHNPHGNGQYRILNPIPNMGNGTFVPATAGVSVSDGTSLPPAGDARNYTIIQARNGTGTLLASQIQASYTNVQGDYLRRRVPWNASVSGTNSGDAPVGLTTFVPQMDQWCSQCHSRYLNLSYNSASGDAIYAYGHPTNGTSTSRGCTVCHVAHGSNAQMTGVYAANETYPGGTPATQGDSRLLKADNRGTCQLCHDPTGTITAGTTVGGYGASHALPGAVTP